MQSVNCISKSLVIDLSTPENDKSDMVSEWRMTTVLKPSTSPSFSREKVPPLPLNALQSN